MRVIHPVYGLGSFVRPGTAGIFVIVCFDKKPNVHMTGMPNCLAVSAKVCLMK